MKRTELSIIIPVYNGQDYISRCLDSIMRQQNSAQYEIIIVNDGSKDDTAKILGDIQQTHKNIRVITQKNAGVSVARNNGIAASSGEYVTFIDCDDMVGLKIDAFDKYFVNPTHKSDIGNLKISTAHNVLPNITSAHFDDGYFVNMLNMATETNADVVLGGKITVNRNEVYMRRHVYEDNAVYGTTPADKAIILRQADTRENANFALYRRDMLYAHNLRFLTNMKLDEDMLFCMLAVLYAERVATVKDVTYFYNRHECTLSNIPDYDTMMQKYKVANIQRFSVLLDELGKMPQYRQIFAYWLREYSKKGTKYIYDSGEFPPMECHHFCDQNDCTGCFVAEAMRESFKNNIVKYLGDNAR